MNPNYGFQSVLIARPTLYKQTFDYKPHYFWDAFKSVSLHLHRVMQFKSLIFQLCNINANSYGKSDIALSVLCILLSLAAAEEASNIRRPLELHFSVCT